MKTKACSVFLLLALVTLAQAGTVSELVAKGCPSPDREWQAKDYAALNELLVKATISLPRLDSESGRSILNRLVDTENLSFHHNRNLPLEVRLPDLMKLMDSANNIMRFYLRAANAGEKVEKELAALMVFELAVASAAIDLVDEFLPTIPKDEKYETRMDGFRKMKSGLITILDGAITSLSERTFYSNESIKKIVRGIRDYYPRFNSILPETAKIEFRRTIEDALAKEKDPLTERELMSLKNAMKANSANTSQSAQSKTNRPSSAVDPR